MDGPRQRPRSGAFELEWTMFLLLRLAEVHRRFHACQVEWNLSTTCRENGQAHIPSEKLCLDHWAFPVQLELTGWPDWPRTWLNSVMLTLESAAIIHLLQLGCIFPVFFDTQRIHARISNTISLSTQTLMDFEKVRFLGALHESRGHPKHLSGVEQVTRHWQGTT